MSDATLYYKPEAAVGDVQSLRPSPSAPSPFPPSPHPPSQAGCHMVPQSELSLPPSVAVAPQQRVVGLEHSVDTGVPAAQVSQQGRLHIGYTWYVNLHEANIPFIIIGNMTLVCCTLPPLEAEWEHQQGQEKLQ